MKFLSFLLALVLLLGTLSGCTADPADPAETTDPVSGSDSDTAPEEPEIPRIENFHLELGEPIVLDQGKPGNQQWGNYQFPSMHYTLDGGIYATWAYDGTDTIEYKGTNHDALTTDGGKTWGSTEGKNTVSATNPMANGCYFQGFVGLGAHKADWIKDYKPAYEKDGNSYYFIEDLPKNEDTAVKAIEYDPKTGKTNTFDCTINWPHGALVKMGDMVYPVTQMFALSGRTVKTIDGVLYQPIYFRGFDSTAETREDAFTDYINQYHIYFFKSTDNGRTWDFVSQVHTNHTIVGYSAAEGLCEPEMTVMPDGSWVMLMRTGSNNPSYITRSTDKGKTWSQPKIFDAIGVMPQLVTLDCGVTIASYGRPIMKMRATSDPDGSKWEKAMTIDITVSGQSCHYTDLIAVDEKTALFIYSDFQYPNADGEPVKTILVRTVTVVED